MWSMLCSKYYSQLIQCEPKSMTEPCPMNLAYLECSQCSPVVLPAGPRRKLLEFHSYLSLEDFFLTFSMYKCLLLLGLLALTLLRPHPSRGDFPLTFWLSRYNVNDRVHCYIIHHRVFFFFLNLSCQMYFGTFCPHVCFVLWTKPPEQSCTHILVWMFEKFLYFGAHVPDQDRLPKWSEQLLLIPEFARVPWCSPSNRRQGWCSLFGFEFRLLAGGPGKVSQSLQTSVPSSVKEGSWLW